MTVESRQHFGYFNNRVHRALVGLDLGWVLPLGKGWAEDSQVHNLRAFA